MRMAGRKSDIRPEAGGDKIEREERGSGQSRHAVGEPGDAAYAVRIAMEQDQPDILAIHQADYDLAGAVQPGKRRKPTVAEPPPDPEADGITCKNACPHDRNQHAEVEDARAGRVTSEKRKQQAVRKSEREDEAIGGGAMLAQ